MSNYAGEKRLEDVDDSANAAYFEEIAIVLKNSFSLDEIDRLFRLADANPTWKIEADTEYSQERIPRALSWFQGIAVYAPAKLTHIAESVIEQVLAIDNVSAKDRLALQTVAKKLKHISNSGKIETPAKGEGRGVTANRGRVFVAHSSDDSWYKLVEMLRSGWDLELEYFEYQNRTAEEITKVVDKMTSSVSCAIVLMTADDSMQNGAVRSRQNVIHEAGMCHGKLGFGKVAILLEDGVEEFSNVDGIQYIPFERSNVKSCLHELGQFLSKHGIYEKRPER